MRAIDIPKTLGSHVITGNYAANNTHSSVDVTTASEKNRTTTLRNAATEEYVD